MVVVLNGKEIYIFFLIIKFIDEKKQEKDETKVVNIINTLIKQIVQLKKSDFCFEFEFFFFFLNFVSETYPTEGRCPDATAADDEDDADDVVGAEHLCGRRL